MDSIQEPRKCVNTLKPRLGPPMDIRPIQACRVSPLSAMAQGWALIFTAIALSSRGNLIRPNASEKPPSTRLDHPWNESTLEKFLAALPYHPCHPLPSLCSLFYTSLAAIRSENGQLLPIGTGRLCPSPSEIPP